MEKEQYSNTSNHKTQVSAEEEVIEISEVPQVLSLQERVKVRVGGVFSQILRLKKFGLKLASRLGLGLKKVFLPFTPYFLPFVHRREPEIYLKRRIPQGKGRSFAIVAGLALLLLISVLVTKKVNLRKKQRAEAYQLLSQASKMIEESKTAVTINPERAKNLLEEASSSLRKVRGQKIERKQVEKLESQIGTILEKAYNTKKIKPQLLADLTLKIEKGDFSNLVLLGNKLYSVNGESGFVAEVDATTGVISTYQLPVTSYQLPVVGFLVHLYVYDEEKGIVSVNTVTRQTSVAIEKDARWQNIAGLDTYLGNLYLLDSSANQIYKYIAIPQGFSNLRNYFTQAVDLSEVCDFAIDGAIYLLYKKGQVEKFFGGERVEFSLSGLYPALESASQIFTYPEAKSLYLKDGASVLIFNKEGNYEQRLTFEGIGKVDDFVVNEKENALWLLSQDKIYKMNL